jgi:hypothetical protein
MLHPGSNNEEKYKLQFVICTTACGTMFKNGICVPHALEMQNLCVTQKLLLQFVVCINVH